METANDDVSDAVSSSFSGEWINATGRYKFRYRRPAAAVPGADNPFAR